MKKENIFLNCFLVILIINALLVLSLFDYLTFKPNNYRVYNYNLVWDECGIQFSQPILSGETYCKIKGVPIKEFIACRSYQGGLGAGHDHFVMARKRFEPKITLDVTSAQIFLGKNIEYVTKDEWRSLASAVKQVEIAAIDEIIVRELADLIMSEDGVRLSSGDLPEYPVQIRSSEDHLLMLQFELEEYENILWLARIIHSGESYYIQMNNGKYSSNDYLPCGKDFSALLDQIVHEYGLSYVNKD